MVLSLSPEEYDGWYDSPRGKWIANTEFRLLVDRLNVDYGSTLLDAGCGTGYFSRRFADRGLRVYGVDSDANMLAYAKSHSIGIDYIQASMIQLPFCDKSYDTVTALTSLCFINNPIDAIKELIRVSKRYVVLGLLNRQSLLYKKKYGKGAYQGARWDSVSDIKTWLNTFTTKHKVHIRTAIFIPDGNRIARYTESWLPGILPCGGFIAVLIDVE